ncbi:MAG TPA: DoxX family protein [Pyrinomonadaceae bacterium]|nr:DoxX family protein [Pyrinomonadaceae bacterium]
MNILLWIIQILLGLLFVFSGSMKFVMSVEQMNAQAPVVFPGIFLHFIGVCEILGGFGLILPGALRIKPGLTPLAATGLAIITAGATVITLMGPIKGMAVVPFVTCVLCIFVAYGRWRAKPFAGK